MLLGTTSGAMASMYIVSLGRVPDGESVWLIIVQEEEYQAKRQEVLQDL